MRKFRTVAAIVAMVITGFGGLFLGAYLGDPMGGVITGVLLSGIACLICTLDNGGRP